jgi:hypothetical protein
VTFWSLSCLQEGSSYHRGVPYYISGQFLWKGARLQICNFKHHNEDEHECSLMRTGEWIIIVAKPVWSNTILNPVWIVVARENTN